MTKLQKIPTKFVILLKSFNTTFDIFYKRFKNTFEQTSVES